MQSRNSELYAKALVVFTGTLATVLLAKTTGILSSFWPDSKNEEDHTSSNDLSLPEGELILTDIHNANDPTLNIGDEYAGVFNLANNFAYVANGIGGIEVIDINNPDPKSAEGITANPVYAQILDLSGNDAVTSQCTQQYISHAVPRSSVTCPVLPFS